MGIFTRFKDIVASNINSMLDKAEDPEKLIKMMIREMEDTLIELKSACAGTIAEQKTAQRIAQEMREHQDFWEEKAQLAVRKQRDDLARQALVEKREFEEKEKAVREEFTGLASIAEQYRNDIQELEAKLQSVREKQRLLTQRHIRAQNKKKAQDEIRWANNAQIFRKVDELQTQIHRMEAEADLVNYGVQEPEYSFFQEIEVDEEIENQLNTLKASQLSRNHDKTEEKEKPRA